jgi:myo-inositol 2-dehydrogenase/D-chiro-inositol 1-dehydrogenase
MGKLKVGIIGAGYMGGVHASILARDNRVSLTAVYDVLQGRALQLSNTCGAAAVDSPESVLDLVDAVYITTPNTRHAALSLDAIARGKHVFSEKPMATTLNEAALILKAAQAAKTIFQVGHNRRFAPVYTALKQLIGERGPVHSAHVKMNRGELINPAWVSDPSVTGGFLFETTIHMFDMLRFQLGEIDQLQAIGSTHEYREVDDFSVLLKFAGGMHATLASSADATWLFPFERIEVFCHHTSIVTREMESIAITNGLDGHCELRSMHQLSKEEKWGYAQEDRAFVDSVLEGTAVAVSALDGFRSVELVDACYVSVREGGTVSFTR